MFRAPPGLFEQTQINKTAAEYFRRRYSNEELSWETKERYGDKFPCDAQLVSKLFNTIEEVEKQLDMLWNSEPSQFEEAFAGVESGKVPGKFRVVVNLSSLIELSEKSAEKTSFGEFMRESIELRDRIRLAEAAVVGAEKALKNLQPKVIPLKPIKSCSL